MTARSGALALVDRVPRPPEPERRQLTLSDLTGDTCSVEEAAEVLGVGRTLAYEMARRAELPGLLRLGRLYRVSVPALRSALGAV